jgi:hypothetical protein
VIWDSAAEPSTPMPAILYALRQADVDDGYLLDAIGPDELDLALGDAETITLDGIVSTRARLDRKLQVLQRVMEATAAPEVAPTGFTVGDQARAAYASVYSGGDANAALPPGLAQTAQIMAQAIESGDQAKLSEILDRGNKVSRGRVHPDAWRRAAADCAGDRRSGYRVSRGPRATSCCR